MQLKNSKFSSKAIASQFNSQNQTKIASSRVRLKMKNWGLPSRIAIKKAIISFRNRKKDFNGPKNGKTGQSVSGKTLFFNNAEFDASKVKFFLRKIFDQQHILVMEKFLFGAAFMGQTWGVLFVFRIK